jgi:hypothetical protein
MKRTKFDRSHVYKTTFDSGKLIPVFVDEVLPGDTTRMSVNYFARLATPIKPIMDNIYLDWFFFFVPNRLVWEHWQNFCFEQEDPDDSTDYVIPTVTATGNSENAYIGSLWDYFGLPVNTSGNLSGISALPFRGVYLIWNEWFRDENLQKSVKIQKGDTNEVLNSARSSEQPSWVFMSGTNIFPGLACPPRGKRHDYFTSAFPWTQKGPGVSIGLAGTASIVDPSPASGYLLHSSSDQLAAVSAYGGDASSSGGKRSATGSGSISFNRGSGSDWSNVGGFAGNSSGNVVMTALNASGYLAKDSYVDLDTSSIFTINSLRTAFQMQKFYERLARGGSRYTEVLRSFFGVVSPDARLQRPEFLGSFTKMVNVNPIAQTSATDNISPQGNLSAYGVTAAKFHACHFSLNTIKSGSRISTVSRSDIVQNTRAKVRALKPKVFKLQIHPFKLITKTFFISLLTKIQIICKNTILKNCTMGALTHRIGFCDVFFNLRYCKMLGILSLPFSGTSGFGRVHGRTYITHTYRSGRSSRYRTAYTISCGKNRIKTSIAHIFYGPLITMFIVFNVPLIGLCGISRIVMILNCRS